MDIDDAFAEVEDKVRPMTEAIPNKNLRISVEQREELAGAYVGIVEVAQRAADSVLLGTEEGDLEFGIATIVYGNTKDIPLLVGIRVLEDAVERRLDAN